MRLRSIPSFAPFALAACTAGSESPVRSVTVAFSGFGCDSKCPDHVISVDSTLSLRYWGDLTADRRGYFHGRISESQWDSVQRQFEGFLVRGIDTTSFGRTDQPDFEMIIDGKSKRMRVDDNCGVLSDSDERTVYWIMGMVERAADLSHTDTIEFVTSAQYRVRRSQEELQERLKALNSANPEQRN